MNHNYQLTGHSRGVVKKVGEVKKKTAKAARNQHSKIGTEEAYPNRAKGTKGRKKIREKYR